MLFGGSVEQICSLMSSRVINTHTLRLSGYRWTGRPVLSLLGSQGLRQRREPRDKCCSGIRQDAAVCLHLPVSFCAVINEHPPTPPHRANGAQQGASSSSPREEGAIVSVITCLAAGEQWQRERLFTDSPLEAD